MTPEGTSTRASAKTLRDEFDRSFSIAATTIPAAYETLLAIRLAGAPYALRTNEIAGLFVDRPLVPVPSPLPELLGLSAFRGQATPVYDLGALLGLQSGRPPRWLVLTRLQPCVALAFESFETRLALPGGSQHDEVVREGEAPRPVIQLGPLMEGIRRRAQAFNTSKEGSA